MKYLFGCKKRGLSRIASHPCVLLVVNQPKYFLNENNQIIQIANHFAISRFSSRILSASSNNFFFHNKTERNQKQFKSTHSIHWEIINRVYLQPVRFIFLFQFCYVVNAKTIGVRVCSRFEFSMQFIERKYEWNRALITKNKKQFSLFHFGIGEKHDKIEYSIKFHRISSFYYGAVLQVFKNVSSARVR